MTSDMRFEFVDICPDEKMKSLVSKVAAKLQFSAPSDSTGKIVIQKTQGAIRASCRIASLAGNFVAETVSDTPSRAIDKLEKKIRAQLDLWKRRRFVDSAEAFPSIKAAV